MAGIKVLIIDDDVKIAEIHRRFTTKVEGFEVVGVATSISEGRDLLDVFEPDLILLDIYFPDENGIEFLWEIRTQQKPIDIILITAAKEVEPLKAAIRGGVFDYIIKPASLTRFQETLIRYKKTHQKIKTIETIEQEDADVLLKSTTSGKANQEQLPKGIDPISLNKIREVFTIDQEAGLSADQVGDMVGMSRSSARRYLEYLVEAGWLDADINYGTVGRPERRFIKA
jgi:two-component system CitB family response regulator